MGLFGGGPKAPSIPNAPPAAHPPTLGSSEVQLAGIQARQKAIAQEGEGFDNTIFTSPQGTQTPGEQPPKPPSTLLG